MPGPITPDQVYMGNISERLFEWVNTEIRSAWNGVYAIVNFNDLNRAARELLPLPVANLHESIIAHYRAVGWELQEDLAGGRLIFMKPKAGGAVREACEQPQQQAAQLTELLEQVSLMQTQMEDLQARMRELQGDFTLLRYGGEI